MLAINITHHSNLKGKPFIQKERTKSIFNGQYSVKVLIPSEKTHKYLHEESKIRRKNYHQKNRKNNCNLLDRVEERRTGIFQSVTKRIKGLGSDILAQQIYEGKEKKNL
ncbi:hypothetical protein M0812_20116 [Anaeramoeba flamelloides]|uniref:Uncharacterized protein n=1 Tax=Anaeramoeba flamelloides TaxID=1746091 RepID=A0AAV7Z1J3_9EUKA|nr:hypothetical protein M0812_20116 [Anaeramoeba flamelloides]